MTTKQVGERMRYLIRDIIDLLKQEESFALATIIRQQGSAPRRTGARMLIRRDGGILGTVGGGALEAAVCESARAIIEQGQARRLCFNLYDLGMFCGGQVEVALDFVDAHQKVNLEVYEALLRSMKTGQRVWLLAFLPDGEEKPGGLCLLDGRGRVYGQALLNDPVLGEKIMRTDRFTFIDDWSLVVEPVGGAATALLFGAGHIAQRLVPLLNRVGFFTSVIDEREEYANRERFADADSILVSSYDSAFRHINVGEQSYIVIITNGHEHDWKVVVQALKTRAAYIGMIASRNKRERVFRSLLDEGYSPDDLQRIHSPIGLDIGAETPEEIAVSIAAEMIKVRAEKLSKL
jgi:Xanthine and CO dehydrogenases maturation factor, XdhC/CoxF family